MLRASLPWYEFEETRPILDRFWSALSDRLQQRVDHELPTALDRDTPYERLPSCPDLLLGQACGYLLTTPQAREVTLVATPDFAAPGCSGGSYRSRVVVRRREGIRALADLEGSRFVANEPLSYSGLHSVERLLAPNQRTATFFASTVFSGSHQSSIRMLQDDRADVAAIDCITWELLRRHRPEALTDLETLLLTPAAPAPPLLAHREIAPETLEALRISLQEVASDPSCPELCIRGFVRRSRRDYLALTAHQVARAV